jgi:hypothetical protein
VVTALHEHDGTLYAGGAGSGFAGVSYGVQKLVGGNWQLVATWLNGSVEDMETFDGNLVIAGSFGGGFLTQDTTLRHVAVLNANTWQPLADGLNGNVYDLLLHNGQLYAGGDCVSELFIRFGMARLGAGSSAWEPLMPNIQYYINSPLDAMVGIKAMVEFGDRIYFGGDFAINTVMTYGTCVGAFLGDPDAVEVAANFNGPVHDRSMRTTRYRSPTSRAPSSPWGYPLFPPPQVRCASGPTR